MAPVKVPTPFYNMPSNIRTSVSWCRVEGRREGRKRPLKTAVLLTLAGDLSERRY